MSVGYDMLAIPLRSSGGAEGWLVIEAEGSQISLDHKLC